MSMPTLHEVVGTLDRLMGVKAVWGRSAEPVMCFGSRRDLVMKNGAHYSTAKGVAEQALVSPYLITIGGGKSVTDDLRGRALELVRATGVFGDTSALIRDASVYERLKQWPVAVVCSEIYSIDGEPEVIKDLEMPDLMLLYNSFGNVRRCPDRIAEFWAALTNTTVTRRWDISPLPGFRDPRTLRKCGSIYPRVEPGSVEGRRIYKEICALERDPGIAATAKAINKARNSGLLTCEACNLQNEKDALFDAHHRDPLHTGERLTKPDNFAILCPTCHRWAHVMSGDKNSPLSVDAVRAARVPQISN